MKLYALDDLLSKWQRYDNLDNILTLDFLCPRDDSQGGGGGIKICPCLSVCLSVRSSRFTV